MLAVGQRSANSFGSVCVRALRALRFFLGAPLPLGGQGGGRGLKVVDRQMTYVHLAVLASSAIIFDGHILFIHPICMNNMEANFAHVPMNDSGSAAYLTVAFCSL
jgi:hypothetical protein